MGCEKCEHMGELYDIFERCRPCKKSRAECKSCPRYAEVMAAYKEVDHFCANCEAGKLHHECHYDDAEGGLEYMTSKAGIAPDAPINFAGAVSAGVTKLDPETEDKLRVVLATVFQLTPIELLLVQFVFTHKVPLAKFREPLREMRDRLTDRYDLAEDSRSFRALVHAWKNRIVAKVPALADVFAANINETAGFN